MKSKERERARLSRGPLVKGREVIPLLRLAAVVEAVGPGCQRRPGVAPLPSGTSEAVEGRHLRWSASTAGMRSSIRAAEEAHRYQASQQHSAAPLHTAAWPPHRGREEGGGLVRRRTTTLA